MELHHTPDHPIGVFDSGIGGLTVANAIIKRLPQEKVIYFGDTAHLPYGDKSADAIRYYCLRISKFLLDRKCKMIVVACNSASSAGYELLLEFFKGEALFVNVVDPLVDAVIDRSYSHVGLIATKATVGSGMYERQLRRKHPTLELHSLATPLLAPMIEEGFFDNKVSQAILDTYLSDPSLQGIQALVLACTHYPLIRTHIEQYFHNELDVIDSTDLVAREVEHRLRQYDLLSLHRSGDHQFYVSDYTRSFEETTQLFYGQTVQLEHCPLH